jgi:hypothetical protein
MSTWLLAMGYWPASTYKYVPSLTRIKETAFMVVGTGILIAQAVSESLKRFYQKDPLP